jgi:hypothetical protein
MAVASATGEQIQEAVVTRAIAELVARRADDLDAGDAEDVECSRSFMRRPAVVERGYLLAHW